MYRHSEGLAEPPNPLAVAPRLALVAETAHSVQASPQHPLPAAMRAAAVVECLPSFEGLRGLQRGPPEKDHLPEHRSAIHKILRPWGRKGLPIP